MPAGTRLRNFRCDDERWSDFLAACADEGTDGSQQLRSMIDAWLKTRA